MVIMEDGRGSYVALGRQPQRGWDRTPMGYLFK
jgi:hypothetical protein